MPGLAAARQLDEISGQQEKLHREYGVTLYIFQPPGGNYDETTITSVSRVGLKGVMLWKEAMQISDMQYQTAAYRLSPGDIILCHFRGPAQLDGETMVRMMTRRYRRTSALIAAQSAFHRAPSRRSARLPLLEPLQQARSIKIILSCAECLLELAGLSAGLPLMHDMRVIFIRILAG